jgi:hypothetical protein
LTACCLTFLAQRCANNFLLTGDRTRIVFPGCRVACCGPHPVPRERVRCFSNNRALSRAGRRLTASDGRMRTLMACCVGSLAPHCAHRFLLPRDHTSIVLPDYKDDRCGA